MAPRVELHPAPAPALGSRHLATTLGFVYLFLQLISQYREVILIEKAVFEHLLELNVLHFFSSPFLQQNLPAQRLVSALC